MTRSIWAILALPLLTVPATAAENPVYHDCRPSEDIVNGRTVHKMVCQNEKGDWVEVRPERKKAPQQPSIPASAIQQARPVKKPIYHDCRPSEDVINGRTVYKRVCQNEAGAWVELPE